jgi:hypothetical protein
MGANPVFFTCVRFKRVKVRVNKEKSGDQALLIFAFFIKSITTVMLETNPTPIENSLIKSFTCKFVKGAITVIASSNMQQAVIMA